MCYPECVATSPFLVHWRHLCPHLHPCLSPGHHALWVLLWTKLHSFPLDFFSLPATFPSPSQEDYSVAQKGRSQRFLEWEGSRKILRGFVQDDQFPGEDYTQSAKVSWAYKLIHQPILLSPFLFFIQPDNKYIMRILLCSNKTKEKYQAASVYMLACAQQAQAWTGKIRRQGLWPWVTPC